MAKTTYCRQKRGIWLKQAKFYKNSNSIDGNFCFYLIIPNSNYGLSVIRNYQISKIIFLLTQLFLFANLSNVFGEDDFFPKKSSDYNTYLLSSGRSGTHLLMYTISYLTKRICGDNRFGEAVGADPSLPAIYQIHSQTNAFEWYGKTLDRENDYLILIMRNYKESLLRTTCENYLGVLKILQSPKGSWGLEIFENLEEYDCWNPKHRLLIYYEELITNPAKICREIIDFLGASDEYLKDFLDNYDYHFNVPLKYYDQTHGGSYSKGKDFHYHTSLLPKGVEEEMDAILIKKYPSLVEKYLKRYIVQ